MHSPVVAGIPKAVKETCFKLLDAFVDFVFEFVDQPLLPSQVFPWPLITIRFNSWKLGTTNVNLCN